MTSLLPYIEESVIYDMFDFSNPPVQDQFIPGTNTFIGTLTVSTYLCPTDDRPPTARYGYALHNYVTSTGPTDVYGTSPTCKCGGAAALNAAYSLGGRDNPKTYPGPFCAATPTVYTPFRKITDGISKTIFMGEQRPKCSVHVFSGWAAMNNGCAVASTVVPINTDTCDDFSVFGDGCRRWCNWNLEHGFRSLHPGGAQFCMGDASVHFLPESIDHRTYQYLGGRKDGQTAALP